MKRRAMVEVLTALKEPDTKPRVTITKTADGSITYSVTATGRDVKHAAKKAKETFKDLARFVVFVRDSDLKSSMAKTLAEMNHR